MVLKSEETFFIQYVGIKPSGLEALVLRLNNNLQMNNRRPFDCFADILSAIVDFYVRLR